MKLIKIVFLIRIIKNKQTKKNCLKLNFWSKFYTMQLPRFFQINNIILVNKMKILGFKKFVQEKILIFFFLSKNKFLSRKLSSSLKRSLNMNPKILKDHRNFNNYPWIILIVVSCLIIVATLISIIIICIFWKRYQKSRINFKESTDKITYNIPTISIRQNQMMPEYEIQSLDMYVPSDDKEDISEYTKRDVDLVPNQIPDYRQMNNNEQI